MINLSTERPASGMFLEISPPQVIAESENTAAVKTLAVLSAAGPAGGTPLLTIDDGNKELLYALQNRLDSQELLYDLWLKCDCEATSSAVYHGYCALSLDNVIRIRHLQLYGCLLHVGQMP